MLEQLSYIIATHLANKKIIDSEDTDIYRFGLEVGISTMINLLFLILTTILFFSFIYLLIFIVFFVFLRQYSGGYHADTHIKCNAMTLLCYSLCTVCSQHFKTDLILTSILFIVGLAMIIITAPIKNHNKTITLNQLPKYKFAATLIFALEIIFTYILVFWDNHYSSNAFCTILCVIILMPVGIISYKRKEKKLCLNS